VQGVWGGRASARPSASGANARSAGARLRSAGARASASTGAGGAHAGSEGAAVSARTSARESHARSAGGGLPHSQEPVQRVRSEGGGILCPHTSAGGTAARSVWGEGSSSTSARVTYVRSAAGSRGAVIFCTGTALKCSEDLEFNVYNKGIMRTSLHLHPHLEGLHGV